MKNSPTVSVIGICGNEEFLVRESLTSILPIADEIVIIFDSNIIDKTKEIVDELKKQNPQIEWILRTREFDIEIN